MIEQAAREYIRLRRLKLDLKAHRNGLHAECGYELGADHDHGGHGLDCCVFNVTKVDSRGIPVPDRDEWCDLCIESDVAHEWYRMAVAQTKTALRRLERLTKSPATNPG